MRRNIKKMAGSILVAGVLATGLATGVNTYAAASIESNAAAVVDNTVIQNMLLTAIEDEYLAKAQYQAIMDKFDVTRPFSNHVKAEEVHINLLTALFEEYGIELPVKDWDNMVVLPDSLEAAYEAGEKAEEDNIEMYESFLKETLPDNVKEVFEELISASDRHLQAYQRQGDCDGTGLGKSGLGRYGSSNRGRQGNRNNQQGECIL
ncbi:ferritin-like domain-containing protein [Anaeromicropila populeti]|uniref:Rubrerythrin diiron-binding domain-containing protein n=1 Tax=Anaeromicropila populeti TaxID=37658 RepID=A0A1I6KQR2_9FIRM|nr:DUF2202 domain-containing protein [Anaeromicropila populeti]SFR93589.1 hypothetical protein SAMN05661086_02595 [Anaeromicropila populeti]